MERKNNVCRWENDGNSINHQRGFGLFLLNNARFSRPDVFVLFVNSVSGVFGSVKYVNSRRKYLISVSKA